MRTALTAVLTALVVGPALAQPSSSQAMPPGYREVAKRKLEVQRTLLLAMADSMPENLYRDKATPTQRDFAQQVAHVAQGAVGICARYIGGERPQLPDTAVAYSSREGLKSLINQAYDFTVQTLENQPDEDLIEVVNFFGRMEIPKWQVWDEIHQHSIWTAGQIVGNFRKHGMAPPAFTFF